MPIGDATDVPSAYNVIQEPVGVVKERSSFSDRHLIKIGDNNLMAYIERGRSIFSPQVPRIGGEAEFSRTTEEGRVVIERLCKCVGGLEREPMAGLLFQRKHRAVVV